MRLLFIFILLQCTSLSHSQQTVGLFQNDSLAFNGYTLWSPNTSSYLIDNCGYLVNEWKSIYSPGLSVYLLENGNLLRTGVFPGQFNAAGRGGFIEEFDWDGNLVWSYRIANDSIHQHHDIEPMPNNNVLVLAWEEKTPDEVSHAGGTRRIYYWPEYIFELKKIGNSDAEIVWEWHQWDHLVQDHDSTKNNFGVIADHPELLDLNYKPPSGRPDWQHINSVFYDVARDEIILSSRNMNEIYVIDHSTTTEEAAGHSGGKRGKGGDFLYRWGNPEVYDRGTTDMKKLYGQHDARTIPEGFPDEGAITIFNNGAGRPGGNFSSIDLIFPPMDEYGNYIIPDSMAIGPTTPDWQYKAANPKDFYSNNMGGAHRLANGNTIICEANKGNFFEVTRDGVQVWRYRNTAGNGGPFTQGQSGGFGFSTSVFKVMRYAPDFKGFEGKDLSPGDPIELDPIEYECQIYEAMTSSSPAYFSDEWTLNWKIVNGHIQIRNNNKANLLVRVFSQDGQLINTLNASNQNIELSLDKVSAGIYILNIIDLDKYSQKSWKFTKIF